MASIRYRSVDDIQETLMNAKARGRGCSLLIGAGCSVTAGIPTADGFVTQIKDEFPRAYERAKEKTYPKCMNELLLDERRGLIARYVDKAEINWAHLCIALLMKEEFVDRVLTTNFDPLVAKACAMLGEFPATYDFAASTLMKRADIPKKAVFHLHGQRTGFVLMNTEEDMERQSKLLGPVFEDAGSGRVWIVVGYSGESDPVFDHLAKAARFDNGLFWIGYKNREPGLHVREKLLLEDKDAFFTKGFDADSFFIELSRQLQIFPPDLVARPFSYLVETLKHIQPFPYPGQGAEDDVTKEPLRWVQKACEEYELQPNVWKIIKAGGNHQGGLKGRPDLFVAASQYFLMQGRFEQVLEFEKEFREVPELADVLSKAYYMRGNQLLDRAKVPTEKEADRLFEEAERMYKSALGIKKDCHEALHNWGNLLLDLGKRKRAEDNGREAETLFAEAEKQYEAALSIKHDLPDVLINWGNLLSEKAKPKTGEEAEQLYIAANDKYDAAYKVEPDMPEILVNWGNMLLDRAKKRQAEGPGEEADRLFMAAEEKYRKALDIHSDMFDALVNWGNLLLDRAKAKIQVKKELEAGKLFEEAEKKYKEAIDIRPGSTDVVDNLKNLIHDSKKPATEEEAAQ